MSASINKLFTSLKKNKTRTLWAIALILFVYFIYQVTINATKPTHGFSSYYTASKLLVEGENVSQFYNNDWFRTNLAKYVPGIFEIYNVNLPTTSLMLLPLTPFDYNTARIIWIIFNCLLLIFTLNYLFKKLEFQKDWIPFILVIFLLFQPLYANIVFAQVYILIFSVLTFALFGYKSGKQTLSGILIGFMIILKTFGLILFVLLLIQKKWRTILWMLVTIIFVSLISLPWIGTNAWFVYADKILQFSSLPSLSVTAYQTIHSFFYHFTVYNQQWNPYPVINLPLLGKLLTVSFSLFLLAAVIFYAFRQKSPELSFSIFIIAGVVLSPVSLDYHYVVLLLPILIFIKWFRENNTKLLWILLFLFYALIAASLHYSSSKITAGWVAIFAYPKLYGALGLMGLFFFQLIKDKLKDSENISTRTLAV